MLRFGSAPIEGLGRGDWDVLPIQGLCLYRRRVSYSKQVISKCKRWPEQGVSEDTIVHFPLRFLSVTSGGAAMLKIGVISLYGLRS